MASSPSPKSPWGRFVDWLRSRFVRTPPPPPEFEPSPITQSFKVGEERRAHVRVPVELRVAVRFDTITDALKSHTVDISHSGMFISTTAPRAVGTRVRIQMTVAGTTVDLTGVVVRRVSAAEAVDGPPGMGVNFEGLGPDAQVLVDQIVAQS